MAHLICPVCEKEAFRKRFTVKDHFLTLKDFTIAACVNCGMLVTADAPGEQEMADYYQSDDYISHSDNRKGLVNKTYHFVRRIMLRKKYGIIRKANGKTTGKILDIGTGTGYFLNFMKEKGWTTEGTEKNENAREFARNNWQLTVYSDNQLSSLNPGSFDAITLWHVLEHLPDLREHFRAMRSLLSKEGILVIAVPNAASFDARHYKEYWAALDVPRHLWHFTPDHIRKLGLKEGFVLTGIHRMPFDAFYISIMSEKYRQSRFPLIKGMIYGKISWLASLFDKKNCSSLVYVFKQRE